MLSSIKSDVDLATKYNLDRGIKSNKYRRLDELDHLDDDGLIFHPFSRFRRMWDFFMAVLIIYNAIAVPFRVAFNTSDQGLAHLIDRLMDCLFLLDIVINFFTGYPDKGMVVMDPVMIANNYIRGWMLLDVVSSIPFDMILDDEELVLNRLPTNAHAWLRLNEMLRLARLLRLLRMLRLARLHRIMNRFQFMLHIKTSTLTIGKYLLTVVFFMHWFSCGFFLLSSWVGIEEHKWYDEFLEREGYDDGRSPSTVTMYLLSMYHAALVMATVDLAHLPQTNSERVFTIITMATGTSIVLYSITVVTGLVYNIDTSEIAFQRKMDRVIDWTNKRDLGLGLTTRIVEYYSALKTRDRFFEELDIVGELPGAIRAEVMIKVHHQVMMTCPYFLAVRDGPVAAAVLQRLVLVSFMPGEVIAKGRMPPRAMYIISDGLVNVETAGETTRGATLLKVGDTIGDAVLITGLGRAHTPLNFEPSSYFAATFVDSHALSIDDVGAVMRELPPDVKEAWVNLARSRSGLWESAPPSPRRAGAAGGGGGTGAVGGSGAAGGTRSPTKQVSRPRLEPAMGPELHELVGTGGEVGRLAAELERERELRHDVERELSMVRHRLHEMHAMRASVSGELGVSVAPII